MESIWEESLYDLIVRTSTDIPLDVEDAIRCASKREEEGSNARSALDMMLDNIALARQSRRPICQDTGALLFWVEAPFGLRRTTFQNAVESAIVRATEEGVLRKNCVDTLTGRNTGDNLGAGSPVVHWRETEAAEVTVSLVLKGGGCENVGMQYSLPDTDLDAGRDLDGVRACVLDAVFRAQGRGCAPGILGVAVGGDRATGYAESKKQLLRPLGVRSNEPELASLEARILEEANTLGIGPMGFGGETTVLDVLIGQRTRIPASYFVSVSYMCWACRRRMVRLALDGAML
ncbi:MAG: fumarate hydratase [Lentisphaeria bacterium]|nr:fumarate hydratase [Lentisphaeria bacterium]